MASLKNPPRWLTPGRGESSPAGPRRPRQAAAPRCEDLEARLVLSTVAPVDTRPLITDAIAVQKAFGTFTASYQSAVSALRQTATTTTAPTAAGQAAYAAAVTSAIQALDTSVASDFGNLPNTGASLVTAIDGYTATLQNELIGAGAGLANSTNASVLSLYRESSRYVRNVDVQSVRAILNDTAAASITPAAATTANNAVLTAFQTFNTSIRTARQSAATAGKPLDTTAVNAAVATLQGSLNSAVAGLSLAFVASSSNPTATLGANLASLTANLTSIAAPTAGNRVSAFRFAIEVGYAVFEGEFAVEQTLYNAISSYNHGLL